MESTFLIGDRVYNTFLNTYGRIMDVFTRQFEEDVAIEVIVQILWDGEDRPVLHDWTPNVKRVTE